MDTTPVRVTFTAKKTINVPTDMLDKREGYTEAALEDWHEMEEVEVHAARPEVSTDD